MPINHPTREAAVYTVLQQIPAGKVIAYGQLAKLAGFPGGARWVGRLMCNLPEGSQLPWHRVVNSQGKISLPEGSLAFQQQRKKLEAEGVSFNKGKISLRQFGFLAPLEN